jgi:hypothetical protein
MVDDQHPTVPSWTVEEPPARRRVAPGLLAAVMAVLLLFGGAGLYAARQSASRATGAGSPESAAAGLLAALDARDLDRAARFLDEDERLLLATYRGRVLGLLAGRGAADLTARDPSFRQVAGVPGVAVLELSGGTVGVTAANGSKVELPVGELDRRLAEQTKGAVTALRLVTVRSAGRWHVALLATAAELARLAGHGAAPDYARLAAGEAAPGADSPEAAARGLAAALAADPATAYRRLAPSERRVFDAYARTLDAARPGLALGGASVHVSDLRVRTEPLADHLARVHLIGGRLELRGVPDAPGVVPLDAGGQDPPYVVTLERDGTWYPSLVFTVTDWLLAHAQRERP